MSNFIKISNTHLQDHSGHHVTTHSKLDEVALKSTPTNFDQILASSPAGLSMVPDETAPIADDNNRNGWSFNKTLTGTAKINWYFYTAGNQLTTLNDLKSITAILSVDNYESTLSLPFFIAYTKPTGVNDASWYKSKVLYQLSPGQKIYPHEEIQAWAGVKPKQIFANKRLVEFNNVSSVGLVNPSEELLTISIHTSSEAPVNTKLLVKILGCDLFDEKIKKRINLRI